VTLKPTNLRTRLTLWYVGVLALLLIVYATVVLAFQYGVLTRQLYHDEVQDVVTVEGLLYFGESGELQLQQNYYSRPQSHLLVDRLMEVRDLSGKVLYRSSTLHDMTLAGLFAKAKATLDSTSASSGYRTAHMPLSSAISTRCKAARSSFALVMI
jgi:hypothetical protein